MVDDGIASLAVRKKISKDDAQNDDAYATLAFNIYGTEQRIHLDKITVPPADEIMEAQSGEKVAGYTLEDINLEYETIDNPKIATDITQRYMVGRSLTFENVTPTKRRKMG